MGPSEIPALVDRAVPLVHTKSQPKKARGAAAAHASPSAKAAQRQAEEPSAYLIADVGNKELAGDGSAVSAKKARAPFPCSKYERKIAPPPVDGILHGK